MDLTLDELVRVYRDRGESVFGDLYSIAVLVSEAPLDEGDRMFETMSRGLQDLRKTLEVLSSQSSATIPPPSGLTKPIPRKPLPPTNLRVYPIRKRPGGAFQDRIGIGRASNADISIPLPAVSKYHAYFAIPDAPDGEYFITDAGSKNGTTVDGEKLAAKTPRAITDGAIIRIGPYPLTFHTPEGLIRRIKTIV